jgi:hypothetical protein
MTSAWIISGRRSERIVAVRSFDAIDHVPWGVDEVGRIAPLGRISPLPAEMRVA